MYNKINRIHLIGIGGIGMSGLAELLSRHNYQVTGSDRTHGESVRLLEAQGIKVFIGHHPSNIEGAELVVFSSAIATENPELQAALASGIPTISRAEMLAELMRIKSGIAVAGAHGKTTTTSMISLILIQGGLDPTVVVGGRMDNFGGTNARQGSGEFMVVEADESDGSFQRLSPVLSVVTNLDREHLNFYKSMRRLRTSFIAFLEKLPFYGLAVLCNDDPQLHLIMPKVTRRKKTYGFRPGSDYQISDYKPLPTGSRAKVSVGLGSFEIELQVPGKHNMLNAVAATAVADELGIPRSISTASLLQYRGVRRRFEKRGEKNGVILIDDYAHHPTEISATLQAARERYPTAKIHALFQPHRYSRVADLFDEFSACFKLCDQVAITRIYAAGESPVLGIDGETLVANIKNRGQIASYSDSPLNTIQDWITQGSRGDIILTMGAGDLPNVYRELFSQ